MILNNQQQNSSQMEINPWILAYADAKKKLIAETAQTIHNAKFIPDDKEKDWILLLPYLSENFLEELKQSIIRESLRKLNQNYKW